MAKLVVGAAAGAGKYMYFGGLYSLEPVFLLLHPPLRPCFLGAGFILGSGGAGGEGGALARFVPQRPERLHLIQEVAHACARAAQLEEAVELFLCAGQPRPALHLLNQQLSDLMEPALEDTSAGAHISQSLYYPSHSAHVRTLEGVWLRYGETIHLIL